MEKSAKTDLIPNIELHEVSQAKIPFKISFNLCLDMVFINGKVRAILLQIRPSCRRLTLIVWQLVLRPLVN